MGWEHFPGSLDSWGGVVTTIRRLGRELRWVLARFDPGSFTGTECALIASELARVAKACETAGARAAARAVSCGGSEQSITESVARAGGRLTGATRAALAVVQPVETCPATRAALFAGEVSLAQAAEVASVPAHEEELLRVARTSGLRGLKDRARKRRLEAVEPATRHETQVAAQEFRHWQDELGMTRFGGALPPEVGVPFVNRVDAEADRLWRAAGTDRNGRSRSFYAAQAFGRMVNGIGEGRPRSADLVIVADLRAYRRGHAHRGEPCHIIGAGPIPVSVAQEAANDAFLKAVMHDGTHIHTVAHFGRHVPASVRTALDLGPDLEGLTCARDGCDRRYHLQLDHIDPWANGGATSFANMEALCGPDHRDKTERDRKAGLLGANRKERGP
jgi:hypothetical protein